MARIKTLLLLLLATCGLAAQEARSTAAVSVEK